MIDVPEREGKGNLCLLRGYPDASRFAPLPRRAIVRGLSPREGVLAGLLATGCSQALSLVGMVRP